MLNWTLFDFGKKFLVVKVFFYILRYFVRIYFWVKVYAAASATAVKKRRVKCVLLDSVANELFPDEFFAKLSYFLFGIFFNNIFAETMLNANWKSEKTEA